MVEAEVAMEVAAKAVHRLSSAVTRRTPSLLAVSAISPSKTSTRSSASRNSSQCVSVCSPTRAVSLKVPPSSTLQTNSQRKKHASSTDAKLGLNAVECASIQLGASRVFAE